MCYDHPLPCSESNVHNLYSKNLPLLLWQDFVSDFFWPFESWNMWKFQRFVACSISYLLGNRRYIQPLHKSKTTSVKLYPKCSINHPGRLCEILTFRMGAYSREAANREGRLLNKILFLCDVRAFFIGNYNDSKV